MKVIQIFGRPKDNVVYGALYALTDNGGLFVQHLVGDCSKWEVADLPPGCTVDPEKPKQKTMGTCPICGREVFKNVQHMKWVCFSSTCNFVEEF